MTTPNSVGLVLLKKTFFIRTSWGMVTKRRRDGLHSSRFAHSGRKSHSRGAFAIRRKCPVAIIKSAVGGTTVAFDWNPDAPEKGQKLYPRTIQLVRDSLKNLKERGIKYRLEGVLWHQGENDMLDRNLYKQYAEGLTKLIARFRTDLNAPDLKWYIAEVSEKGIWGMDHRSNLGILHQQQQQVLKADPLLRWVPTSHLAFEVMGSGQPHYHYGTQGQL